jgi:hypothetical protein
VLCFCFDFLRLVYGMLPVSLECPFMIAPSVLSNVYLQILWNNHLTEGRAFLPEEFSVAKCYRKYKLT